MRLIAAIVIIVFLQGCKHPISIEGEGDVVEELYGVRGCTLEEFTLSSSLRCLANDIGDEHYQVQYRAVPRPGWRFVRWEADFCTESKVLRCSFDLPETFMAAINSAWPDLEIGPIVAVFEEVVPGIISYLDFESGDPGLPGDGLFTEADLTDELSPFLLADPLSLENITEGFALTMFPLPDSIASQLWFWVVDANYSHEQSCEFLSVHQLFEENVFEQTVNDVLGISASFSEPWLQTIASTLMAIGCGDGRADDLVIVSAGMLDQDGLRVTALDAASLQIGNGVVAPEPTLDFVIGHVMGSVRNLTTVGVGADIPGDIEEGDEVRIQFTYELKGANILNASAELATYYFSDSSSKNGIIMSTRAETWISEPNYLLQVQDFQEPAASGFGGDVLHFGWSRSGPDDGTVFPGSLITDGGYDDMAFFLREAYPGTNLLADTALPKSNSDLVLDETEFLITSGYLSSSGPSSAVDPAVWRVDFDLDVKTFHLESGCKATRPFHWPVEKGGSRVSQPYAEFDDYEEVPNHYHTGTDIGAPVWGEKQDVFPIATGSVVAICASQSGGCTFNDTEFSAPHTDDNHGFQGVVILKHELSADNVVYSMYAHLSEVQQFEPGQCVSIANRLGKTGGYANGHLHLEMKPDAVLHNPTNEGDNDSCLSRGVYGDRCWGYTLVHPSTRGYLDPASYIEAPSVAGLWEGTATAGTFVLDYSWNIEQVDGAVSGSISIEDPDTGDAATYLFAGSIEGDEMSFEGTEMISNPSGRFCMVSGTATLSEAEGVIQLNGLWGPSSVPGGCPAGSEGTFSITWFNPDS